MNQSTGFEYVPRPSYERNDCAVRALANATGMDYFEAHAILRAEGRRDNAGTKWAPLSTVYGRVGTLKHFFGSVEEFMLTLGSKEGASYILRIPRHVFAVKSGVMMDMGLNPGKSKITHYWEICAEAVRATPAPVREAPKPLNLQALLERVKSVKVVPAAP